MERVHFNRRQKAAFWVGGLLMLASIFTGPYFAAEMSQRNTRELVEVQKAQAGIQHLLDFIAGKSPEAKTSQAAQIWYVEQFRAICAATAGCVQVKLPPSLGAEIHKQYPGAPNVAPTTIPAGG